MLTLYHKVKVGEKIETIRLWLGGPKGSGGDTGLAACMVFYCGRAMHECRCGYCGDQCGPTNGCPCNSCDRLRRMIVEAVSRTVDELDSVKLGGESGFPGGCTGLPACYVFYCSECKSKKEELCSRCHNLRSVHNCPCDACYNLLSDTISAVLNRIPLIEQPKARPPPPPETVSLDSVRTFDHESIRVGHMFGCGLDGTVYSAVVRDDSDVIPMDRAVVLKQVT